MATKKAKSKKNLAKRKPAVKKPAARESAATNPGEPRAEEPKEEPQLPWPLWALSQVRGRCKYVRFATGAIVFVDPMTCASHSDAARAALGITGLSVPAGAVLSAGRVIVEPEVRTVTMGPRDSESLGVSSAPGDEDAQAVAAFLFGGGGAAR